MNKLPSLTPPASDQTEIVPSGADLTITPDIAKLMDTDPPPSMEPNGGSDNIFVKPSYKRDAPLPSAQQPKPSKVDRRRREHMTEAELRAKAEQLRLNREKAKLKREQQKLKKSQPIAQPIVADVVTDVVDSTPPPRSSSIS